MRISRTVNFQNIYSFGKKKRVNRQGQISVPMYSDFFSSLRDTVMCTNTTFSNLHREIDSTLSTYSEKASVVITVYESSSCSDDTKESVLVGFRKYIARCLARARASFRLHLIMFTALAAVGVLLEFLLYGAFPELLPTWALNVVDIVAWVFVWQFAAYMAFEFVKEIKTIRRFDQILHLKYTLRHWE